MNNEISIVSLKNTTKKKRNLKKIRKLDTQQIVREHISIDKARMRNDPRPIEENCTCYTCRNFSRAYLHHLFKAHESLGSSLVTCHNIHFMNKLMSDIREGIENDTLDEVEEKYVHPDLKSVRSDGIFLGQ